MLRDVSAVDMKTSVLGQEISFPVGVGATGLQRMAHKEGEIATTRGEKCFCCDSVALQNIFLLIASAKLDTCMILSVWTNTSLEDVAEASDTGLRWFQTKAESKPRALSCVLRRLATRQ